MAVNMAPPELQEWSRVTDILESKQQDPSGSSSPEFFDAEDDRVTIVPAMDGLKEALQKKSTQNLFDERYMSSEEDLSPAEHGELSDSDYDLDDLLDNDPSRSGSKHSRKSGVDLAIAVTIISVGKPKVVDVPASPTTDGSDRSRHSSLASRRKQWRPRVSTRLSNASSTQVTTPLSPASTRSVSSSYSREDVLSRPSTSFGGFQFGSVAKRKSCIDGGPSTPSLLENTATFQPLFLSTDPFAIKSTSSIVSPMPGIKPRHSRLRSIGRKISLIGRKIKSEETSPTIPQKRWDSFTILSPALPMSPRAAPKMQARGASEREPTIEIPPCPYDADFETTLPPHMQPFARRLAPYRRRSLLGLG